MTHPKPNPSGPAFDATDPEMTAASGPNVLAGASDTAQPQNPDETQAPTPRGAPAPSVPRSPGGEYDFLAPPQQADELGRLGPYRVLKVLGAGGMGIVFLAEDPQLQRKVALKVMRPHVAAQEVERLRFIREARTTAALEHDHIIAIYQVGEDNGVPFLAMPLLKGETLDDRLKREGLLPVSEVLRIGREMAEGLAAAHEKGLIHRDIKPGNVWLEGTRSRVKILDFGLARQIEEDVHLTQTGAVSGTPAYMAPEQARGEPVDARCDLFSLGCVLYRMATGDLPFKGPNVMAILMALANQKPDPPSVLNPDVPQPLNDLILRLLAKSRSDRPATAAIVAEILMRLSEDTEVIPRLATAPLPHVPGEPAPLPAAGESTFPGSAGATPMVPRTGEPFGGVAGRAVPAPAPLPPAGERPVASRRPVRRRRSPVAVACLGLLVLLAGGAGALYYLGHIPLELKNDQGQLVIETNDPTAQVVLKQEGAVVRDPTSRRQFDLPPGEYEIALVRSREGLRLARSTVNIAPGSKEVVRIIEAPVVPAVTSTAGPESVVPAVHEPSPLDALDQTAVVAAERVPGQPAELVAVLGQHGPWHWGPVEALAVSRDGKRLASGGPSDNLVRLWDAATLTPRALLQGPAQGVTVLAFSPDGRLLAAGSGRGPIHVWDVAGPEPREFAVLTGHTLWVRSLAFAPDNRTLASGGNDRSLRLWDLNDAVPQSVRLPWFAGVVGALAFSPDGKLLASGSNDKTVRLWEVGSENPEKAIFRGQDDTVRCLTFSADGKTLYAAGAASVRVWDGTGVDTKPRAAIQDPALGLPIALAPGGRGLASLGETGVRLWTLGNNRLQPRGDLPPSPAAAFTDDGNTVYLGGVDGTVHAWDLKGPKPEERNAPSLAGMLSRTLALTPDHRTLAVAGGDGTVRLWDLTAATPKEQAALAGHAGRVTALAIAPDGTRLVSGGVDGTVRLWDLTAATPRELAVPVRQKAGIHALAYAPDGKTLAVGSEGGPVRLLDMTGDRPREGSLLTAHSTACALAFAPDSRTLATAADGSVRLWSLTGSDARERAGLTQTSPVHTVAFAPDNKALVTGGEDGVLRVWDLAGGEIRERTTLPGHGSVQALTFAPRSRVVAAVDSLGQLLLWDLGAGKKVREVQLPGLIRNVAFADARHVAVANGNGTVYVLRLAK